MFNIQRDANGLRIYKDGHLCCAMDGISTHLDEMEEKTLQEARDAGNPYIHRGFYWEQVEQIDGCPEWKLMCSLVDKAKEAREIIFYCEVGGHSYGL